MKNKLNSINNIPFLACLGILLVNDFYLKAEYPNWLTGKLSDFCGLFVFVLFWAALFPTKKQLICVSTGLLFIFWKSPYSQTGIDFFSEYFYPIHRVVDITDLMALSILPIAFYFNPHPFQFKFNPFPLALLSIFAFCATSMPRPTQRFEQPQYLLFKSGLTYFTTSESPNQYEVYPLDSLVIIHIKEIAIKQLPAIDDDFHKVQVLRDLDLRLLREATDQFKSHWDFNSYETRRDSLIIDGETSVVLKLDSFTDHLHFNKTRLDGHFKRFSKDGRLIIDGKYKNGLEDSVWTFYNAREEVINKKYFENGEQTKMEIYSRSKLKSESKFDTRQQTIRNKYIHLAILLLLIVGLLAKLFFNFISTEQNDMIQVSTAAKIVGSMVLPFVTLVLVLIISSFIPNPHPSQFFGIVGETILVYLLTTPVYFFIFFLMKLRSRFDLLYYTVLLSLAYIFMEEWFFLKSFL
jgi:hypothetical protein